MIRFRNINTGYSLSVLVLSCFFSVTALAQNNLDDFFDLTGDFFAQHVESGQIDYSTIKRNPLVLIQLIELLENANLAGTSRYEKKSFYINAYNLTVVKSIIDSYPIGSVQDIKGFFNTQKHRIAREMMSLDELEQTKLLGDDRDPRFHFVLVCGAKGCPPIIAKAYRPDVLEEQLTEQTARAINDSTFTKIDVEQNKLQLSRIFEWYKRDIENQETTLEFVNKFLKSPLSKATRITFYPYDWRLNDTQEGAKVEGKGKTKSNIQAYTAGVLLKKGQVEGKIFNNLYTQTQFFDEDRKRRDAGGRSNFFAAIGQFSYGISARLNIGLDVYFKSTSNDAPSSSPLGVFALRNNAQQRFGITTIGPKVKYAPFKAQGVSLQTTLLFPLGKRLEGSNNPTRPYIEYDGLQLFQQFLYDKSLGDFNLYGEASLYLKIDTRDDGNSSSSLATPLKFFPSYFYGGRFSVYLMSEWAPTWGDGGISDFYLQSGIGHKFQITQHLELEALYTNFLLGKNKGAGQTFNLGMRVIY